MHPEEQIKRGVKSLTEPAPAEPEGVKVNVAVVAGVGVQMTFNRPIKNLILTPQVARELAERLRKASHK